MRLSIKRTCPLCRNSTSKGMWTHFNNCHVDSGIDEKRVP